jgi:hypothetical protein
VEVDPTRLQDGLQEYRLGVSRHLNQMQDGFEHLERRWYAFSSSYEGAAAEEFRAGWLRTCEQLRLHIGQMERLASFLDERIDSLRDLNQG